MFHEHLKVKHMFMPKQDGAAQQERIWDGMSVRSWSGAAVLRSPLSSMILSESVLASGAAAGSTAMGLG